MRDYLTHCRKRYKNSTAVLPSLIEGRKRTYELWSCKLVFSFIWRGSSDDLAGTCGRHEKMIDDIRSTNSWRYDEYYYPASMVAICMSSVEGSLDEHYWGKELVLSFRGELCRSITLGRG